MSNNHPNRAATAKLLITAIPFSGFYESMYSSEIDSLEERECENLAELECEKYAPEFRLEAGDFGERLFDCVNYQTVQLAIAKTYTDALNIYLTEAIGFDPGLKFESMISPREYNFETDRIYAHIPRATVRKLFTMSARDGHKMLMEVIAERFTSRSGFISYYENQLNSWLAKRVTEWDHNELETLLIACHRLSLDYSEDWDWRVFEAVTDCDGLLHEWESGVDWPKFDAEVEKLRESRNPSFSPASVKCDKTSDLFRGA